MVHHRFVSTIALGGMLVSGPLAAQTTPSTAPAQSTPDFSGLWVRPKQITLRALTYFTKEDPPMLPAAAERYKELRGGRKDQDAKVPEQGQEDMDPAKPPYCMPYGFPRTYTTGDSIEILQNPGRVYLLFQDGEVQRIYTDGRTFPQGPPLSFMGQSIGRWEGDTLVVETKEMNEFTWLDSWGHIHSDALRVEQRIRRLDRDTLEINFLFDDPKIYTKPWTAKRVYRLGTATEYVIDYFICEDPKREEFEQKAVDDKKAP
jgi:hypothetical protein